MKRTTGFSQWLRKNKYAWMLAGSMLMAGPAYAHDYSDDGNGMHRNHTYEDCVHGSTGSNDNLDCSRGRSNRHTDDIDAYNTDTGVLDGSRQVQRSY